MKKRSKRIVILLLVAIILTVLAFDLFRKPNVRIEESDSDSSIVVITNLENRTIVVERNKARSIWLKHNENASIDKDSLKAIKKVYNAKLVVILIIVFVIAFAIYLLMHFTIVAGVGTRIGFLGLLWYLLLAIGIAFFLVFLLSLIVNIGPNIFYW